MGEAEEKSAKGSPTEDTDHARTCSGVPVRMSRFADVYDLSSRISRQSMFCGGRRGTRVSTRRRHNALLDRMLTLRRWPSSTTMYFHWNPRSIAASFIAISYLMAKTGASAGIDPEGLRRERD